jgi:hypothetical protein
MHPAMFHNWDPRSAAVLEPYNRDAEVCLAMRLRSLDSVAALAQRTCRLLDLQPRVDVPVCCPLPLRLSTPYSALIARTDAPPP